MFCLFCLVLPLFIESWIITNSQFFKLIILIKSLLYNELIYSCSLLSTKGKLKHNTLPAVSSHCQQSLPAVSTQQEKNPKKIRKKKSEKKKPEKKKIDRRKIIFLEHYS